MTEKSANKFRSFYNNDLIHHTSCERNRSFTSKFPLRVSNYSSDGLTKRRKVYNNKQTISHNRKIFKGTEINLILYAATCNIIKY